MFVQPRAHTSPWAVYSDKITLTRFNCIIVCSGNVVKMKGFYLFSDEGRWWGQSGNISLIRGSQSKAEYEPAAFCSQRLSQIFYGDL